MPIFHHFSGVFLKEETITLTPEWLQARELLDATDISQCCSQPFFQLHPVGFKADLVFQQHCGDLRRC